MLTSAFRLTNALCIQIEKYATSKNENFPARYYLKANYYRVVVKNERGERVLDTLVKANHP